MKKWFFLLLTGCFLPVGAKSQTVGLFLNDSASFNGYTLFGAFGDTAVYLIDNCGEYVQRFASRYTPGASCYLMNNGNLLRASAINNPWFPGAGRGGRLEIIDWNNNVVWSYDLSDSLICQHHDIHPLPNGNILAVAWDRKTQPEAVMAGRVPANMGPFFWGEKIIEIQPIGSDSAAIVWEWAVWDHLIQDFDNTRNNFGVVADHPELININYNTSVSPDWLHFNTVSYNPVLDQVIMSSHRFHEFWVVDHSTTTQEAASHSGGNSGKGGDILYRWGNPVTYNRGTVNDQKLFGQHDPQWIPAGQRHAGGILVFNNGLQRPGDDYSLVEIIMPPVDQNGNYINTSINAPFGPAQSIWKYPQVPDTSFYGAFISGVQMQPNGNVLICEGPAGSFREVDSSGQLHWAYINPITYTGITSQGDPMTGDNSVFKIRRYAPGDPRFAGRNMISQGPIELNPQPNGCNLFFVSEEPVKNENTVVLFPNPAADYVTIRTTENGLHEVIITDMTGKTAGRFTFSGSSYTLDCSAFPAGVYDVCTDHSVHRKMSITR